MQFPNVDWKLRWFIDDTVLNHEGSRSQGRKLTYQALELGRNNFIVTLVSSLGFFTSTYLLFASTTILPMLGFVYWRDSTHNHREHAFDNITSGGCIVGMLVFGICADLFGRRRMYGFEIVFLMIGTFGFLMSSPGYVPLDPPGLQPGGTVDYTSTGSMDVYSWLLFWRFVTGIGIGAGYPLDAVIASEYAPTHTRPRILAIVFSMRSFGVGAGAIVSLIVAKVVQSRHPFDPNDIEAAARAVDGIWRWTIGLALIPAVIAGIMRFAVPESPRYTLDVLDDPIKASKETERFTRMDLRSDSFDEERPSDMVQVSYSTTNHDEDDEEEEPPSHMIRPQTIDRALPVLTIKKYFIDEGNWRTLVATSLAWFCLDFSTFTLRLNNATTLSRFWFGPVDDVQDPKVWDSNTVDPNASIYAIITGNSVHLLALEFAPSVIGSIALVLFITRLNRRLLAWITFIISALLLIVTGVALVETVDKPDWSISAVLYALTKFINLFGPDPLTFTIVAELFPTKYRASCHGISAASGKLGSIIAFAILDYIKFGDVTKRTEPTKWLGYLLMVFAAPLLLAALVYWWWIPDMQDKTGESYTLEVMAEGRKGMKGRERLKVGAVVDRGA